MDDDAKPMGFVSLLKNYAFLQREKLLVQYRLPAPSDEGAVSEADWGRENPAKNMTCEQNCKLFSPSVTASPCHLPPQREAVSYC